MARRCFFLFVAFGVLTLTSCQRAQRYPAPEKKVEAKLEANEEVDNKAGRYLFIWRQPQGERRDLPIQFVSQTDPEWQRLPAFWTNYPLIPLELGQDPLQTVIAAYVTDRVQAIKIKVPRGLPDPNEHIPKSNPPTYGKWRIGQLLFHERLLPAGSSRFACATCHKPDAGFADDTRHAKLQTLSLVNVVYNRRQFWDGRVEALEETIVRSLAEDQALDKDKALEQHNWPGFVKNLVEQKTYADQFQEVFGIDGPTQNSVAQALATYMRTILSGDSLYDRAEQVRKDKKAERLLAEHFLDPLKDENAVKALQEFVDKKHSREQLAALLEKGHEVFRNKGRCVQCHAGPLFTDGDFHNVGYHATDVAQPRIGTDTGRAVHVPVGRKEMRLVGAFRTPTLRNLGKIRPFFHDAKFYNLADVVKFYDEDIWWTPHLAQALKVGNDPRRLKLAVDEKEALELFVRALEGTAVDPIVTRAAK